MKWYMDDMANYVLIGSTLDIIPVFKSIQRYEYNHGVKNGCGYGTWQSAPRKRHGVMALVFDGRECRWCSDADYITQRLIDKNWEEAPRIKFFPNRWWEDDDLLAYEPLEDGWWED